MFCVTLLNVRSADDIDGTLKCFFRNTCMAVYLLMYIVLSDIRGFVAPLQKAIDDYV